MRRGPAWTNPGLKAVSGVAQVLAVVCGLAYRREVKMKAERFLVCPNHRLNGNLFGGASLSSGVLICWREFFDG